MSPPLRQATRALLLAAAFTAVAGALPYATADARTLVVTIGNNKGRSTEVPLRYAERDATRFGEVLRRLGQVAPSDLIEVRGETADAVRQVLHQVNVRIRQNNAADTALIVYYSGHADAQGLHLGGTTLAYDELKDIVVGSPAQVRVLVLDGCRSGGLTRVKGAQASNETFDIELDHRIEVEGLAIMTSSAANEDSQESQRLKGSFFTHHLVAALSGAGDEDGDRKVTLSEAYAYAARRTLASSGRTRQLQHPTFSYDIKGRGDFVMTRLASARDMGRLVLHAPTLFLVREDDAEGPLQAEVTADREGTVLTVPSGDYFVQARFPDHYEEFRVDIEAGADTALNTLTARRIAYARLVRKGGGGGSAHGLYTMGTVHSPVLDGQSPVGGATVGYGLVLPWATLTARGRFGLAGFDGNAQGDTTLYGVGLGIERLVDWPRISLGLGLTAEGLYWTQQVEVVDAPELTSFGLALSGLLLTEIGLTEQVYARIEAGPVTQLVKVNDVRNGARSGARIQTRFGGFAGIGLGVRL